MITRGDVGQLRAGESRPRATARHRDRQRRDPRRSSHCCGVDRGAAGPHPTGLEPVTTGSSPPDEAAVRPRPAAGVITHGFRSANSTRRVRRPGSRGDHPVAMSGSCARASLARAQPTSRPATPRSTPQQSLLRRGSRGAAGPHPTGLEPVTTGSSPRRTRPQCGLVRQAEVITHGFPVGELDAASSPTGKPRVITVAMSGSCARASLARAQLPDIATGNAAIHAAAVTAAAWITGAAGPHPTGLEPVTTGSSPPDELPQCGLVRRPRR